MRGTWQCILQKCKILLNVKINITISYIKTFPKTVSLAKTNANTCIYHDS